MMNKIYFLITNIVMVIFCLFSVGFNIYSMKQMMKVADNDMIVAKPQPQEYLTEDEISDELLYKAIKLYELDNPAIVLAQAKLETGDYKSIQYRENNNLFGLYNSKAQKYMSFEHWSDCVYAYKMLIQNRLKKNEDYYHFLERIGYAEDEEYIVKLKVIYNKLDNKFKTEEK